MNTNYVPEIMAARNGQLPPSFYAMAFSAYARIRYEYRTGDAHKASLMLSEYDRVHKGDKSYWLYRNMLSDYQPVHLAQFNKAA